MDNSASSTFKRELVRKKDLKVILSVIALLFSETSALASDLADSANVTNISESGLSKPVEAAVLVKRLNRFGFDTMHGGCPKRHWTPSTTQAEHAYLADSWTILVGDVGVGHLVSTKPLAPTVSKAPSELKVLDQKYLIAAKSLLNQKIVDGARLPYRLNLIEATHVWGQPKLQGDVSVFEVSGEKQEIFEIECKFDQHGCLSSYRITGSPIWNSQWVDILYDTTQDGHYEQLGGI